MCSPLAFQIIFITFNVRIIAACRITIVIVEYFTGPIVIYKYTDTSFVTHSNLIINDLLRISCCCLVQYIQHFQLFITAYIALRVLAICVLVRDLGYYGIVFNAIYADRYLLCKLRLGFVIYKQRLYFKIIGYYIFFRRL